MPSTGEKQAKRDKNTGRFAKGNHSGGRKKIPEDIKDALKAASKDAAEVLIETMKNPAVSRGLRVKCAEIILERVYGKPTQPIDGDINGTVTFALCGDLLDYAK